MIPSPRSPRTLALAALLAAGGCSAPFSLIYCEGEAPQPIHCDCTRAPREVAGGRVGRIDIREYDESGPTRHYQRGDDLRFVLLDRWLVIAVASRRTDATSLQAWLDCGGATIAGEIAGRAITRDSSGVHEHEFLALFPGSLADDPAQCVLHVVFADGNHLAQMAEHVYAVRRVRRSEPLAGLPWDVPLADDFATPAEVRAGLAPPPPPPGPRLCRGP